MVRTTFYRGLGDTVSPKIAEAACRMKHFSISCFSLVWGRDADGRKVRLKRPVNPTADIA